MEVRNIISAFSQILPLDVLVKKSGKNLLLPFYHCVNDNVPLHIKHLYRVRSVKEFREDIDFFSRNFQVTSPEIFLSDSPENIKRPSFILSFDDGLKEVHDIIAPILKEKGIPAIFFLNNNFIGNEGLFYRYKISLLIEKYYRTSFSDSIKEKIKSDIFHNRKGEFKQHLLGFQYKDSDRIDELAQIMGFNFQEYLQKEKPYMDKNEVKSLINDGFFIGAHSFDHPQFSELNDEDQSTEVIKSAAEIKKFFKLSYAFFAFPFSDDHIKKEKLAEIYALKNALDAGFGTSGLKKTVSYSHFQRVAMEKSKLPALNIIKTEYLYYLLKSLLNKN